MYVLIGMSILSVNSGNESTFGTKGGIVTKELVLSTSTSNNEFFLVNCTDGCLKTQVFMVVELFPSMLSWNKYIINIAQTEIWKLS